MSAAKQNPFSFEEIVADLSMVVVPDDCPTFNMDGTPVRVNAFDGAMFKEGILRAYSDLVFQNSIELDKVDSHSAELLARGLSTYLDSPATLITRNELVAVEGSGIVGCYEHIAGHTEPYLLEPGERLFGNLAMLGHGTYMYVDAQDLLSSSQNDQQIAVRFTVGTVAIIDKPIICSSEGYGQVVGQFARAVLPIPVDPLVLYKTY